MLNCEKSNSQSVNPLELRKAFGTFVTGVTVLTTIDDDGLPRGMTVNSFTSVSMEPPLLLVCVGKSASSCVAFEQTQAFAVNVLHEGQTAVSNKFASKSPDKFAGITYDSIHTGSPVLTDSLTWFDCSVHNRIDAGDHIILVGQVRAFGTSPVAPLGFCRGRYASVKDPLPQSWLGSHGMVIGYLIESAGKILLRSDGKGGFTLPTVKTRKADSCLELEGGNHVRVVPEKTFLYSVFDVADSDPGCLVYRASLATEHDSIEFPGELQFFPLDQLPYEAIVSRDLNAVLRRYAREYADERFGIYMDSSEGGRVAMLAG